MSQILFLRTHKSVTCVSCKLSQLDRGRSQTCIRCGFKPLPSYSYNSNSGFHPNYKPVPKVGKAKR